MARSVKKDIKMRIGIVCYPTYGGSGVVATELGKGLADLGHIVHFITYAQPARLDHFHENIFYNEVRFADYPLFDYPPYETALASKLVDVVKNYQLDILHVHYAIPHASVAYLAKKILLSEGIYIPTVTTLHGTDITLVGRSPVYEPVVTFAMNKSDGLTAVSESLKKDTFNHFQISKQIEVIPNFVDISRFKRKQNCSYRNFIAPNNEKILIHVSNFRAVKRVEDTIHILSNLVGRVSVKLLLVGDGPERQNVEMLAREMNLMHHIHFLGKQDAIEDLLSVSDLFLMPSASESFGLSALEAMACQVPVVSSDVGGLPEVNINGITGYCCKVGDITDMSEKSFQILTNDSHLELLRANSLEQANKFSIQKIIPIYEEYYKHIIDTFVY